MIREPKRNSFSFRTVPVDSRARWMGAGVLIAGVGGVIAIWGAHPSGWIPACPTNAYLGFLCPGCGSMRATHHLLNLRLGDAFAHNPLLVVLGVPLGALFACEQAMSVFLGSRPVLIPRSGLLAWISLAVLLLFAILRNIPGPLHDALAPPDHEHESHSRSMFTPPGIALRNDLPYPVVTTRGSRITT